jgi:hypothetical protein
MNGHKFCIGDWVFPGYKHDWTGRGKVHRVARVIMQVAPFEAEVITYCGRRLPGAVPGSVLSLDMCGQCTTARSTGKIA